MIFNENNYMSAHKAKIFRSNAIHIRQDGTETPRIKYSVQFPRGLATEIMHNYGIDKENLAIDVVCINRTHSAGIHYLHIVSKEYFSKNIDNLGKINYINTNKSLIINKVKKEKTCNVFSVFSLPISIIQGMDLYEKKSPEDDKLFITLNTLNGEDLSISVFKQKDYVKYINKSMSESTYTSMIRKHANGKSFNVNIPLDIFKQSGLKPSDKVVFSIDKDTKIISFSKSNFN